MTRRCSHCSNNGHNSRTCPTTRGGSGGGNGSGSGGGVKLFGVRLTDGGSIIKKSASVGNLSHYYSSSCSASPNPGSPSSDPLRDPVIGNTSTAEGYVSDDPAHASCSSNCRATEQRKKGTPWTEEEHRLFLLGLQKLGKGDWRGIARNFVISRTPTQVASHAQKYFIRQSNSTRRKRRSSLFDMVPEMSINTQTVPEEPHGMFQVSEDENVSELPNLHLSLDSRIDQECEPMETTSHDNPVEAEEIMPCSDATPIIPAFLPTYLPVPFPFWPPNLVPAEEEKGLETSHHQVLKPTAVLSKDPVNVDELVCMSKLTLGAAVPDRIEPSALSLNLVGSSSRQSAFHANKPVSRSSLSKRDGNAIPAA